MGPRNENEVTFREYIENRLKSLEQRFDERWESHKEVHNMGQKAFDAYQDGVSVKLHDVNKLRDQTIADRQEFLRSDIYEREHQAMELKIEEGLHSIKSEFEQRLKSQELTIKAQGTWIDGMTGKLIGAGVVILALASVIAWLIPHPWGK